MRITGEQLRANLEKDPDWCIGKKVVVTTFADLTNSPIRSLSPNIQFIGRNEYGDVVRLWGCKDLTVLEGVYEGGIDAGADGSVELEKPDENGSTLKKISANPNGLLEVRNCKVNRPNLKGYAADFGGSESLSDLSGKFDGAVLVGGEYQNSVPLSTKGLEITGCNDEGTSLISIWTKFKKLEGKFSGSVAAYFSEFEECGKPHEIEIKSADKNGFKLTAYPTSPFKELPTPEDYPFRPGEVTISGADETGDQGQENDQQALEDLAILKEQIEAFKKREAQRIKNRPWTEQAKREMVKSIAERLKLDDMLKEEGVPTENTKRFRILKLCPIVITVALLTAGTFGKDIFEKVKEKTVVEPIATTLVDKTKSLLSHGVQENNVQRQEELENFENTEGELDIPTRYFGPLVKYLQSSRNEEDIKVLHKETTLIDQLRPEAIKERLNLERNLASVSGLRPNQLKEEDIVRKIQEEFNLGQNPWKSHLKKELLAIENIYNDNIKMGGPKKNLHEIKEFSGIKKGPHENIKAKTESIEKGKKIDTSSEIG